MITKEQIIDIARDELTPIGWHEEHAKYIDGLDAFAERLVKLCNISQVINWVAVKDQLPKEEKFRMSADVLTIAGDKMSVKCYDYELCRWSGSPHVTVKYWMELPKPPCL